MRGRHAQHHDDDVKDHLQRLQPEPERPPPEERSVLGALRTKAPKTRSSQACNKIYRNVLGTVERDFINVFSHVPFHLERKHQTDPADFVADGVV